MNKNVKPGPGGWATIGIACLSGENMVRAQLVGPFAVHQRYEAFGLWHVSHIRTGLRIPAGFSQYSAAAAFAKKLRELVRSEGLEIDNPDFEAVTDCLKSQMPKIRDLVINGGGLFEQTDQVATDQNYAPFKEAV